MSGTTEVEKREGRGRCLIAKKYISLGDLIFEARPLSAVLDEAQARVHCANCFRRIGGRQGRGGSRCSGCQRIWYCSRSCQKADWAEHRPECKAWSSQGSDRTPTRTLRLAGRVLHSINREVDSEELARTREAVAELVDHNAERAPGEKEQYKLMAAFVAQMCVAGCGERALVWPSANGRGFPGLTKAAYAVIGKISCNVFSVTQGVGGGVVGCGLYLEAATANHSCSPNAAQTFDGVTLALRCTRPIAKGEEITIGIVELHRPGRARREALRSSYFFDCRCERCDARGAVEEDRNLEGYACRDKSCPGVCARGGLASTRPRNHASDDVGRGKAAAVEEIGRVSCRACGDSWLLGLETEQEHASVHELLEWGKANVKRGELLEGRRCMEVALQRATCLHRGNWMVSEIYAELVSVCLELEDFEAAATHAHRGIRTHRACMSALLPCFAPWANHLAIVGKLLLCVRRQPARANPLLEEALSIIEVTHGDRHPLYREVRDLLDQASVGG